MRYLVLIIFFISNSILFSIKASLIDSLKTDKVETNWTEEGDYLVSDYKVNPNGVSKHYNGFLFYKFDYEGIYIDKKDGKVFQRKWLSHSGDADAGGYSYNLELGNWDLSPTDSSKVIVGEYDPYTGGECRVRSYENGNVDTLLLWINDKKDYHRNQRGSYYFFALSDSKFLTQYDITNIDGPYEYDRRISNYINSEEGSIFSIGTLYSTNYINLGNIEIDYQKNRIITSSINKHPYDFNQQYPDSYNFFKIENDSLKNQANIRIGGGSWFKAFVDDTLSAYRNLDSLILYNYATNNIEETFYIGSKTKVVGHYQDSDHGVSSFVLVSGSLKKLLSIHLKTKNIVKDSKVTAPFLGKFLTTLTDGNSLSIGDGNFLYKHNLTYLNFDTVRSNFNTETISDFNIQFYDSSFGPIASWEWDFGDGGTSFLRNPSHKYNQSGKYQVTLKVVNEYGNQNAITKEIKIEEKLNSSFDFGIFNGVVPLNVEFNNHSSQNSVRYIWNFGDGTYSYEKDATHTYTIPGTYTVSLTVFDEDENFRTYVSQKKIIVSQ